VDIYNNRLRIGTVSPNNMLHVASTGTAQFDGAVSVGGNFSVTGGTVTLPSGSIAATAIVSLDAGKITTGTFTVGAFGSANIATTGTLACAGSTINAGNGVNTLITMGASGNTGAGSSTQFEMYGANGAGTRLYAWQDGATYLKHANLFAICSLNSTTPQFSVSSTGNTTVANTLTVSGSTTCAGLTASGTLTLNSGDQDKIILTNVSYGSKIAHESGWIVGNYAGASNAAVGTHTWSTGTATGWSNRMNLINNGNLGSERPPLPPDPTCWEVLRSSIAMSQSRMHCRLVI
jgi:hypothetical protein